MFITVGCSGQPRAKPSAGDDGSAEEVTTARAARVARAGLATVALTASTVVSGFAGGVMREVVTIDGLKITRHPITRTQYAACVAEGVCRQSQEDGCVPEARQQLGGRSLDKAASPKTCLRVIEAATFCKWAGGRLPTLPEWLLAARGAEPRRFAWGDVEPTCQQHPRAGDVPGAFSDEASAQEAGCVPAAEQPLVVGQYPDGAAPSGMQDVLLTPGELLAAQSDAQFSACSGFAGCSVYGVRPGAIDSVYPLADDASENARAPHVYGFRCVLEGK
jgi:hypothetical protein